MTAVGSVTPTLATVTPTLATVTPVESVTPTIATVTWSLLVRWRRSLLPARRAPRRS
jgi:hypothetical protein